MITVGLTNWAKHPDLLEKKSIQLVDYAQFYNCVEVDSFFYGIKDSSVTKKWEETVDNNFQFIIKASKEITRQEEVAEDIIQQQCQQLIASLSSLGDKLVGVLLQFPANFMVNKENLEYLIRLFDYLSKLPLIVEFRNMSWYDEQYRMRTINFMKKYHVTLAMVDEPQVGDNCVPLDLTITNDNLAFFRLHGRNTNGWRSSLGFETGARTNYDYSSEELNELAKQVQQVSKMVKNTIVIFNNNGGLHANQNAIKFQEILGLDFKKGSSEQIKLL